MSSLAGRPLCVYASHLHIVQWSVTWCSAAQLPADRLPSYITAERATLRFQVDVTLEGYHSGCSAFFFILAISSCFHLSWKKKKLNKKKEVQIHPRRFYLLDVG